MKLFTKICMIMAAVAGGLGILGIIIGLVLGADINELNNMGIYISPNQQMRVSGVIIEDVEEYRGQHHSKNLHNHTCSLRGVKRLEVKAQNAEITIFATDSTEDFSYYSNKVKNIAEVDGSTLKIEDHSSIQDKIKLELYIPVGVLKEIEIEAINGTVSADKIAAENVTIEIDNASVQIDELVVEEQAELQINAGQMVVGYYSGNKLETECAMGSIMVVCEGNQNDYNYDLECGMGQIQIQENNYSGIGKNLQIHNESDKFIKAECALGEIILEFPNSL